MDQHVRLHRERLRIDDLAYDLTKVRRICVIGAGKASAAMASALEGILGDRISDGCIVTKYAHAVPCRQIKIREAGHPVVDQNGLKATAEVMQLASDLDDRDLAIVLISGGASALLERFPDSIPLGDAQLTFELLLRSGADIGAMNAVRKHISLVKGGRLARALSPCPSVTLLISDVIGNPLDVIGSGPTAPDPTTFRDAYDVLERFKLTEKVPRSVITHLRSGLDGISAETPNPDDPVFRLASHRIIASNEIALRAAHNEAARLGYNAVIVSASISGEAQAMAKDVTERLRASCSESGRPTCLLYGGEMTVTVRGSGIGGRCQEFVVAAIEESADLDCEFLIGAIGTDGTDGPTDAAGGMITNESKSYAAANGLSVRDCLEHNNSYNFLKSIDSLLVTGPTGTNVMDICVAMLPQRT